MVEHSTADREVPGSNTVCPLLFYLHASDNITTDCEGLHIRFDDVK